MPNLPPLTQRIIADPTAYVAGMGKAGARTLTFQQQVAGLGTALGAMGAIGTAVAAKLAVDFDREMTRIETLVGVNREQVDEWREAVLALSETGRGPRELARAMFVVTSAGERGAATLGIVEGSAKAAAVGLGETAVIARTVTAAMQAWSSENLTAAEALDILLVTVREGNLEAESLAGTLGRVMGIASAMGVSFAEVGGFIATFSRLGVDANIAATSLRATLSALLSPTDQTREAMFELGTSIDEVRESIRERGLTITMIELIQATEGNLDVLGKLIPNVRALSGVLATAGVQAEAYLQITTNIVDSAGALDAAFQRVRETPAQSMAELRAKAEAVFILFGTELLPVLDTVVSQMSVVAEVTGMAAEAFALLPGPVKDLAVAMGLLAVSSVAYAVIAARLRPLLVGLRPAVAGLYASFLALNLATMEFGFFMAAFAMPITLAIVAVGGLGLGLALLVEKAEAGTHAVAELGEELRDLKMPEPNLDATRAAFDTVVQMRNEVQALIEDQKRALAEAQAAPPEIPGLGAGGTAAERMAFARAERQLQDVAVAAAAEALAALGNQAADLDAKIIALSMALSGYIKRVEGAAEGTDKASAAFTTARDALTKEAIKLRDGELALFEFTLAAEGATEAEIRQARPLFVLVQMMEAFARAGKEAAREEAEFSAVLDEAAKQMAENFRQLQGITLAGGDIVSQLRLAEIQEAARQAEDSAQRMAESFADATVDIVSDFDEIGDAFGRLVDELITEFLRMTARMTITGPLQELFASLLSGLGGGGDGVGFAGGARPGPIPVHAPVMARGGTVPVGEFAIVGEAGPELVTGPGTVTPLAAGPTINQSINFNIAAVDAAGIDALLRKRAPTIARIVQQASQDSEQFRRAVARGGRG